jgi:DNA-binding LytR/AlgR family response regulator
MIKTIIVEDEIMARKSLEKLCSKNSHIHLVESFENAEDTLDYLSSDNDIDLLLLDIEMPGLSGIDLLDRLKIRPQVIFTTSHTDYAYEAFEYEVCDFLKKPILADRFTKSVLKAKQILDQLNDSSNFSAENEIYIKQDGRFIRIPYKSVYYFENVGDYIKVFTEKGNFIIYGALKTVDAKLSYPGFLKVHRSYIVNLEKIKDIEDNTLVIEKKVIPISRAYKPILFKTINIL